MQETKKIHRQMTIEQILGSFPQKAQRLAHVLTESGLHCVGCGAATWETLEAGVLTHGMAIEVVDELEKKLNAVLEEQEDLTAVTLTPKAAKEFIKICQEKGKAGWGMRFSEHLSGCNGFEYDLDFSEQAEPDDTTYISEGIEIHVKNVLIPRLIGSTIDYIDGLTNAGFKVSNPNVQSSCHCGSSHGY